MLVMFYIIAMPKNPLYIRMNSVVYIYHEYIHLVVYIDTNQLSGDIKPNQAPEPSTFKAPLRLLLYLLF